MTPEQLKILEDKRNRSLQGRVEVAPGKVLVVRRPLPGEYVEVPGIVANHLSMTKHCTVSWEGFTEKDIYPAGDDTPVPFHSGLYSFWLNDHPELWERVVKEIDGLIGQHQARIEEAKKK